MNGIGSTIAAVWRISAPYFRSDDKWAGRGLLAAVIALELASVAISVLLNSWNNRFYNALQERNWDNFVYELSYFTVLAMIFIAIAVYQLYLNQWLQIRWRSWMTTHYLTDWLAHANHLTRDHAPEHCQPAGTQGHLTPVEPIRHLAFKHEVEFDLAVHVRAGHTSHIEPGAGAEAMVAEHHHPLVVIGMKREKFYPILVTFVVLIHLTNFWAP